MKRTKWWRYHILRI